MMKITRQSNFHLLLGSLLLSLAGPMVDLLVRRADHQPNQTLVRWFVLWICFWLFLVLPSNLVVAGIYIWRKWSRFRGFFILLPSALLCFFEIQSLLKNPPTAANRFLQANGISPPASVNNLYGGFRRGFIRDDDTFYFTCSPADTRALITMLKLQPMPEAAVAGIAPEFQLSIDYQIPIEFEPLAATLRAGLSLQPGQHLYFREEKSDSLQRSKEWLMITDKKESHVFLFVVRSS